MTLMDGKRAAHGAQRSKRFGRPEPLTPLRCVRGCFILITVLLLSCTSRVNAGNIDLSTVPNRDTVQLTIYNSEDLTLVRETRKLTFKKGVNPIEFSWANTLIDPTSVELKFVTSPEKLDVVDTTYPHDRPQVLYWNVQSDFDGEATVQITYFTSGITWSADYSIIANQAETQLSLQNFVRVTNRSGEDYDNAQVRLVVGTINLVQKIAELAGVQVREVEDLRAKQSERFAGLKKDAAKDSFDRLAGDGVSDAKKIIKEGLSEYFIYTIEGTETIPDGWSKRLRSLDAREVPLKIQYRYRPQEYGDQLVRMYLLTNDTASKLGTTPLPDGVARFYRDNGRDGLSFLGTQSLKYIPIGEKIELNLGADPQVIFELRKRRVTRDNIWMQFNNADVERRVDDGAARIDVNSSVVGWDDHEQMAQRIRNYSAKPIDVEIRRSFDGDVVFKSGLTPTLFDYRTVQFSASIDAGKTSDLPFEILRRQGRNAKQNNVTLENAQ